MREPDIYLCATDQSYLREALTRMSGPAGKGALPETLAEWKQVDVTAPFWAVRHYRKETAANDPSSPLRGPAAANVPAPKAIGFTFHYDPKSKTARARYLSNSDAALDHVRDGWTRLLKPTIEMIEPGVGCR